MISQLLRNLLQLPPERMLDLSTAMFLLSFAVLLACILILQSAREKARETQLRIPLERLTSKQGED